MGCQSTYSPPITLPTAAAGATGPTGPGGVDGIGLLKNTSGTDYTNVVATGDQTLKNGATSIAYTTSIDQFSAKDIISVHALITVSVNFVGTMSIKYGTTVVGTFSVPVGYVLPRNQAGVIELTLDTNINFVTTSTQTYDNSVGIATNPITIYKTPLANCSEAQSAPVTLDLRANPTAGTITCKEFLVLLKKI